MNENQTTSPKEIAVDVRGPGGAETVAARKLPLGDMVKLAQAFADLRVEAALYVGRSKQWADGLTDAEVMDICAAGRDLNADTFARWVEFQNRTPSSLKAAFASALNSLN